MKSNDIKEFFHFTTIERNGAIGVLLLCFIVLFFSHLYAQFFSFLNIDSKNYQSEIASFRAAQESKEESEGLAHYSEKAIQLFEFNPNTVSEKDLVKLGLKTKTAQTFIKYRDKIGGFKNVEAVKNVYGLSKDYERLLPYMAIKRQNKVKEKAKSITPKASELFPFDPNTASQEELERLGLPSHSAKAIVNYRKNGRGFKTKKDLQNMYMLDAADYQRIEPYIQLSLHKAASNEQQLAFGEAPTRELPNTNGINELRIDINQSTAEQWQQLRGVGPGYSRRITQFRIALGGFQSIEQVGETYDLPDSVFQSIKPFLVASPISTRLSVNTATEEQLSKHPYISWKEAKLIVKYRTQHGTYQSIEDIKNIRALKAESIERFAPYLDFSE